MKTTRQRVRMFMMLALCGLMIACTQPTSDAGGLQDAFDEFEVDILAPRGGEATGRVAYDINDNPNVVKVYAKVFNSSRVHLTAVDATSDISGVTKLTKNGSTWSATVKLAAPASGTITFMIWAVNSSGEHLYSGDGNLTVGSGTSITVPTGSGYSLRDMGPAGGYIFYDKGSYGSDGWRYLEAARSGWRGISYDPGYIFGHYMPDGVTNTTMGTTTGVGAGEANTLALVSAMGSAAYNYTYGSGGTTANYAAKICADHAGGGCEDWFLPSKDELSLIYQNLKASGVGGFSIEEGYWSSSEDFTTDPDQAIRYAWALYISSDSGTYYPGTYRQNSLKVRPVRAF